MKKGLSLLMLVASSAVSFALADTSAVQVEELSSFGPVYYGPGPLCGPKCLYIGLRLLGLKPDLTDLTIRCNVSHRGTSLADLKSAAESYGVLAQGLKANLSALKDIPMPAIAHMKEEHFVLIVSVRPQGIHIVNPPHHYTLKKAEFGSKWSGRLLTLSLPKKGDERPSS